EEQHLRVPVIGRQRPAMAEHNGLTFAPVFVENLNAVFCCNFTHVTPSLLGLLPLSTKSTGCADATAGRPPCSDALVNQSGEEAGIDDELAPLRVEGRGRFGRDGLISRPSL